MTIRTIVVGTDGSENAAHALRWTADLAAQLGARVVAVHAFEPLALLGKVEPPVDFAELERRAADELSTSWCQPLRDAGVEVDPRCVEGDPIGALVDVADEVDADLIVVGARGLGTMRGIVLGSTSLKLPHVTRRPVTIIHPPDGV